MANESYDLKTLKSGGFMKQKEKDLFSVRLRVIGGYIRSEQLIKLAEIANKYGREHLHLTTRQGIEIPYVHFNDFDKLRQELAEVGLEVGACGPRVRTITACPGEICSHGLISPQKLAKEIDRQFFGLSGLPHKFKIGIAGCPNSCTKPYENDFGIRGTIEKDFLAENCNGCGLCLEVCPIQTIYLDKENIARYDPKKCIGCGECVFICPTGTWQKKREGFVIFIGGKMGKFPQLGERVGTVWNEEKLFTCLKETIKFYQEEGKKGERFGETISRLGVEYYKKKIHPF